MKIEDIKKALKHLIKEEVRKAVAEEVNRAMGKVLVEMVKEIKSSPRQEMVTEAVEVEEEQNPAIAVIKTKNPKLASVLAETSRHYKPLPKTEDSNINLSQLMDGRFDKIGHNENIEIKKPTTKLEFLKQMVGENSPDNQPSVLDGGTEVPDILKKVFKKDFRAVMQRMDEQKKTGSSGYIDSSKLLSG